MEIHLSRIRKAPKYLKRYQQILTVLARYGLADWVDRLPLGFTKDILAKGVDREVLEESREGRVRKALGELGPIFIKLGQLMSSRPDIVGTGLALELQKLQDHAPADPPEQVRETLREELEQPSEALFEEIDFEPLASASIAQVHRARLRSGEEVVLKIQHQGLEERVETDIAILLDLAGLIEEHVAESRSLRPVALVEEFRRQLLRELDFRRELHSMQAFRAHFEEDAKLVIPETYPEWSTASVLTMQYLQGVKATHLEALQAAGVDPAEVAREGARIFLDMIFEQGLFHGDPHPGNFLVTEEGRIALLDFGFVGRVDEDLRRDLEDILIGVTQKDSGRMAHALIRMGAVPADLDRGQLQGDLSELLTYYAELPLGEIDLAPALREVLEVIHRHRIVLPPDLSLLFTVVIKLEGTGRKLDPSFQLMNLLLPYQEKISRRRLSPQRQIRKLKRLTEQVDRLLETAPASLTEIIRQIEGGKLTFQLHVEEIEKAEQQLEKSTNRITFGILTASIILASSLLLLAELPPLVGGYSALGLAGYALSLFFALRLLWAIVRSGNLN